MTTIEFGAWGWLIAGLLLCAAEMFAPGVFLLWIGLAALATGLVQFALPMTLATALVLFGVLTLASVLIGRRYYGSLDTVGDRPLLNQRAQALVGSTLMLEQAIFNGEGRVRVHDTVWRVKGADAPAGARVRVTGVEGGVLLTVEPD